MITILPPLEHFLRANADDDEPYPNSLARFSEGQTVADTGEGEDEIGFWRRQFQPKPTERQVIYDWAFGVVVPLICFFFDPIVFRSGLGGGGLLVGYKAVAYPLAFVSIVAMTAWLLWRDKLGTLALPLSGLFAASGLISLIVGAILFPFSLIGMFMLIGFLGFTPLFSAVIFARNAVRAFDSALRNDKSSSVLP